MRKGAPEAAWRTTKMSACMADRLATVSSSDSPLVCEEAAIFRLITSADSRFAAISKVVRVRVDGSKKRLNTLLPRRIGTFFTSRSVTPTKDSAVSRICTRISRGRPSMESRCCSSPLALSCGLRCTFRLQDEREFSRVLARQAQPHAVRYLDARAEMLGTDRELAPPAVGQDHERDARRPAVVEKLVHRRAHRPPAVEDVVDQQELCTVHVERDLGAFRIVLEPARGVVIAVKRDVHQPKWLWELEDLVQPLCEPCAARIEADHRCLRSDERPQLGGELLAELFCVRQLRQNIAPESVGPRPSPRSCSSRREGGFPLPRT